METLENLPDRRGESPEIIGPAPHGQVSQVPPVMVQEELWGRMRSLPYVYSAPTLVSVSHARALFLPEGVGTGPMGAFQRGREFAHIHPHHDGSLHVTLPADVSELVVRHGWGEPHPVQNSLLLFGPRDRAELEVVWLLVQASYRYAMGA